MPLRIAERFTFFKANEQVWLLRTCCTPHGGQEAHGEPRRSPPPRCPLAPPDLGGHPASVNALDQDGLEVPQGVGAQQERVVDMNSPPQHGAGDHRANTLP